MNRFAFIIIIIISFNGCSHFVPMIIPFNDLPKPTGLFNVGTQVFEWKDSTRLEWFTSAANDYRRLVIQVWYPTIDQNDHLYHYLDYPNIRLNPLSRRIELPEFLIRHIKDVKSNSIINAQLLKQNKLFPLILFSHGLGGMRMQNTVQMEELASHGYIVIAMDHPFDANITIFEDGTIADFRSGLSDDATEEEFWNVRIPQINTRANDLSFVLNQIEIKKDNNDELWRNIDISKIGVFGHSFGGATSIVATFNDIRFDACINLDGWMEPINSKIIKSGLKVPFLYIGQEKWKDTPLNDIKLDSIIISSGGIKYLLPGTTHFDYSDTPQFSPISRKIGIAGTIESDDLRTEINNKIISFFDLHVKNAK